MPILTQDKKAELKKGSHVICIQPFYTEGGILFREMEKFYVVETEHGLSESIDWGDYIILQSASKDKKDPYTPPTRKEKIVEFFSPTPLPEKEVIVGNKRFLSHEWVIGISREEFRKYFQILRDIDPFWHLTPFNPEATVQQIPRSTLYGRFVKPRGTFEHWNSPIDEDMSDG